MVPDLYAVLLSWQKQVNLWHDVHERGSVVLDLPSAPAETGTHLNLEVLRSLFLAGRRELR